MTERKILVLLDGTAFRQRIVPHIERLFPPGENQLILLGVVSPPDTIGAESLWAGPIASVPTYIPSVPETGAAMWEGALEACREALEQEQTGLEGAGYAVTVMVQLGDVVEEVARAVEQHNVDVVALATRARGGLSRLVLGSIAQDVVHRLHVPVLLVHPREEG